MQEDRESDALGAVTDSEGLLDGSISSTRNVFRTSSPSAVGLTRVSYGEWVQTNKEREKTYVGSQRETHFTDDDCLNGYYHCAEYRENNMIDQTSKVW